MAVKKATSAKNKAAPPRKVAPAKKAATNKAVPARSAAKTTKTTKAAKTAKTAPTRASATKSAAKVTKAQATKTQAAKTAKTAPPSAVAAKSAAKTATKAAAAAPRSSATKSAAKTTAKTATKAAAAATRSSATKSAAKAATKSAGSANKATVAPLHARTPIAASARPQRLRVRDNEKPWTAKELTSVRVELEGDIARLRNEIASAEFDLAGLMRDAGDGAGDDQADAGTKTFEREQEISLANNAREMFEQSGRALARIVDGSYGICESCGNPIGKNRLLAFPRATLCMTCKSKQERR
jgi:RNA polymerase-binding transcription factor DksA